MLIIIDKSNYIGTDPFIKNKKKQESQLRFLLFGVNTQYRKHTIAILCKVKYNIKYVEIVSTNNNKERCKKMKTEGRYTFVNNERDYIYYWIYKLGQIKETLASDESSADSLTEAIQLLREEFLGQFKDSEYSSLHNDICQLESTLTKIEKMNATRADLLKVVNSISNHLNAIYTEMCNQQKEHETLIEKLSVANDKLEKASTPEKVGEAARMIEEILHEAKSDSITYKLLNLAVKDFQLGDTTRSVLRTSIRISIALLMQESRNCYGNCKKEEEAKPEVEPKPEAKAEPNGENCYGNCKKEEEAKPEVEPKPEAKAEPNGENCYGNCKNGAEPKPEVKAEPDEGPKRDDVDDNFCTTIRITCRVIFS